MDKEKTESQNDESTVPQEISAFAAKLGADVGGNFSCYVYRIVKDEESGRTKQPFIKKYVGVEPDPLEIAERFRVGTYKIQFIWYVKSVQHSKSYTLDVDAEAFPAGQKPGTLVPAGQIGAGMSESVQLQLATIAAITDVMKSAYSQGGIPGNRSVEQSDPIDMFSGMMETMEAGFSRAMSIQSKILERVYTRNMEKQFGLAEEVITPAAASGDTDESSIIGKYAPIVKEVVDGIKSVVSLFGTVPPEVIKKVKGDARFQKITQDPAALVEIGQGLRHAFGDEKAAQLMTKFGVRMVFKTREQQQIAQTPEIGGVQQRPGAGNGSEVGKSVPESRQPVEVPQRIKSAIAAGKVKKKS